MHASMDYSSVIFFLTRQPHGERTGDGLSFFFEFDNLRSRESRRSAHSWGCVCVCVCVFGDQKITERECKVLSSISLK